jgi:CBS domain-containing protein
MDFSSLRAGDVVELPNQPVVGAEATEREAAFAMHGCGTDAVVVLDAQRSPVGVVTAADLVALIAATDNAGTGDESTADEPAS